MIKLLDNVKTRSTSNTSPTIQVIFTLKNSNVVYGVLSINTFHHFINSNVTKFYDQMPFLMPSQYGDEDRYFPWEELPMFLVIKDSKMKYGFEGSVSNVDRGLFKMKINTTNFTT